MHCNLLSVLVLAGTCWAQQGVDVQAPGVRVQTNPADAHAYDNTCSLGEKRIVRASELIGTNVQNNADETVGEINDIVIDPNDGSPLRSRFRSVASWALPTNCMQFPGLRSSAAATATSTSLC